MKTKSHLLGFALVGFLFNASALAADAAPGHKLIGKYVLEKDGDSSCPESLEFLSIENGVLLKDGKDEERLVNFHEAETSGNVRSVRTVTVGSDKLTIKEITQTNRGGAVGGYLIARRYKRIAYQAIDSQSLKLTRKFNYWLFSGLFAKAMGGDRPDDYTCLYKKI